ncbi:hypothetical protein D3C80_2138290 [compost metagenome]
MPDAYRLKRPVLAGIFGVQLQRNPFARPDFNHQQIRIKRKLASVNVMRIIKRFLELNNNSG